MSLSADGRHVTCDGTACLARADVPVALRPLLGPDKTKAQSNGWLFAARRGEQRHYCPDCLPWYLESLAEAAPAPEVPVYSCVKVEATTD